ncbi:3-hydroxyacyl-CoA dehydrogenase [Mesorhizobium sp. VK25A]|uniref:3-hydroxyacyl-CoA dehydrogenase n=1 Tax=Mesorhizobium vachelliae TaxID=3072309 RepID=A0ABU5A6N5_9HYPH|nr:3-hydroxyacyl-CoA dehydrogenase [Mesorhizobium sp. VK25A]MDX8533237.1 3-hydroxyacyl-CoA dehydrogenase [Mesorhizobium sp. VK25D]MDX8545156.1 3-hydroxyacyl-CoA dehydrogenase [Mesorhizobium sp. VK25A]
MSRGRIEKAGVVGAGVMGSGIAEVLAAAGVDVMIVDEAPGKAAAALDQIASRQRARATAGKVSAETVEKLLARIEPVETLDRLAGTDLVVEAIIERLEPKRQLIGTLEKIVGPDAIIATNTSSLSVTAIASAASRPQRVAGYHFFNPVPVMKLVEVISGARTAPEVEHALVDLATRFGHRPVIAADTPGFIVNHAGRAFGTEALAMLREGVASIDDIDAILRDAAGFRMGPFELMDLTGLDVSHPVMESIYNQFYQDPRYRPSVIAARRVEAGLLGRKTKRGFYDHGDVRATPAAKPVEAVGAEAALPGRVTVIADNEASGMQELVDSCAADLTIDGDHLILIGLEGEDVAGAAVRLGLPASLCVGFDPFFGIDRHVTLVASAATSDRTREAALSLVHRAGRKATMVEDSCGAVCQRVIAMIVNIGSEIVEQKIASAPDLDAAVRLGLGYPLGPLEWGDKIGPKRVLRILDTIYDRTRDPRYRASLWLRRRAELGLSLQ